MKILNKTKLKQLSGFSDFSNPSDYIIEGKNKNISVGKYNKKIRGHNIIKSPRIALLGCGYWGKNLARNFNNLAALKLVCDPAQAGREIAKEKVPGVAISCEFEDAIYSNDIDAVVIATPAESHFELAVTALKAGKDVFVEKPMALNVKDGLEMQSLANENGRILMVGHLLEYHSAVLRLRELIGGGELGNLNYIYSNRLNFGKIRTKENALWSFAPHDIAVILRLFNEMPCEVSCVAGNYITSGVADVTVSNLKFRSGRRAHIFVSWLNPYKEQKLVVVGEKKMAVFNDSEPKDKLVLYNNSIDYKKNQPVLLKNGYERVYLPEDEPLRNECEHFLDCIRYRRKPLTDTTSGINVLRVLEACQKSLMHDGKLTKIPTKVFAKTREASQKIYFTLENR